MAEIERMIFARQKGEQPISDDYYFKIDRNSEK